MYHREHPITPSQQATNGALDLFVAGSRLDDVRQQLIGLSVLRSATEAQIHAAMPFVEVSQRVTRAQIEAIIAS